jgi:CRP-like cAMP-binding protein
MVAVPTIARLLAANGWLRYEDCIAEASVDRLWYPAIREERFAGVTPMITPEEMKAIKFLRNLSEQHLNQIATMARRQESKEGTVVFSQGQVSPFIYLVLSGNVVLEVEEPVGKSVAVSTIGPGELVGWSPVLGRLAMTATARAVTDCRLAVLDVQEILDWCERDPRFGAAFLRQIALVLSERLWDTRRNLARALSHRPLLTSPMESSD